MIANCITASRILFSLLLLALPPLSSQFSVLYLLCGVSDVLDGYLARKLHTESRTGALLDSIADLFFASVYVVKILPILQLPLWIRLWILLIAIVKSCGILLRSKKEKEFYIEHSPANKLTGILIFLLPIAIRFMDGKVGAVLVCAAASIAAAEEIAKSVRIKHG